jgi:hypothetical protein
VSYDGSISPSHTDDPVPAREISLHLLDADEVAAVELFALQEFSPEGRLPAPKRVHKTMSDAELNIAELFSDAVNAAFKDGRGLPDHEDFTIEYNRACGRP